MLYLPLTAPPLGLPFEVNLASPQANGLAAWWPTVGWGGGEVLKDRGDLYHGKVVGGPASQATEVVGNCLRFDTGYNKYVIVQTLVTRGYPFSATAWVRLTNASASGKSSMIIQESNSGDNRLEWRLYYGGAPQFSYYIRDYSAGASITGPSYGTYDGVWRHIVCVSASATDHRMYINGVLIGSSTTSVNHVARNQVTLGVYKAGGTPDHYLASDIADIRIYRRDIGLEGARALYLPQTRWELYGVPTPGRKLGPVTVNAGVADLPVTALTATILAGAVSVETGLATITVSALDPTTGGQVTLELAAVAVDATLLDPTAIPGETILVVGVAAESASALNPSTTGTVTLVPLPLSMSVTLLDPLTLSPVTPDGLSLPVTMLDPTVVPGATTLTLSVLAVTPSILGPLVFAEGVKDLSLAPVRIAFVAVDTGAQLAALAALAMAPTTSAARFAAALLPATPVAVPASGAFMPAMFIPAGLSVAEAA